MVAVGDVDAPSVDQHLVGGIELTVAGALSAPLRLPCDTGTIALDALVAAVCDVDAPGVDPHPGWGRELAVRAAGRSPLGLPGAVGAEAQDPIVAAIGDVHAPRGVDRHPGRGVELNVP